MMRVAAFVPRRVRPFAAAPTAPTRTTQIVLALALVLVPVPAFAVSSEVLAVYRSTLPPSADDAAWSDVAAHVAPLIVQDMVEPRLLEPSTREVRVRAVTDGKSLAFRLEWADSEAQDVHGVSGFSDACAVQVPAVASADVPAPQMGEPGKPVEITYWRAAWQATVDGRADTIRALHPRAVIDHYPFDAASLEKGSPEQLAMEKRYAPARALGNELAGPRAQPVQDLVADGPGTIRPAESLRSTGGGKRTAAGWIVQLVRPLPAGLAAGARSQVAFAVWQGSHGEVGARKMRSVWIPLALEKPK